MKGTLHITNHGNNSQDILTYSIHLGYGVAITQYNQYHLIVNSIRAARKVAKKFNVTIQGIEYYDKDGKSYKI